MIIIRDRAVFLDRDGVINEVVFRGGEKPIAPWGLDEFKLIPGTKEPLEELSRTGYYLFVVSNQPDIAKRYVDASIVEQMNGIILETFPIHDIMICPHDDRHNCNCRKPKPGMLLDLSKKWGVDLRKSFLIGDNWKDIEAGRAAGCKTILLDKSYNKSVGADYRVGNLDFAVKLIKSIDNNIKNQIGVV